MRTSKNHEQGHTPTTIINTLTLKSFTSGYSRYTLWKFIHGSRKSGGLKRALLHHCSCFCAYWIHCNLWKFVLLYTWSWQTSKFLYLNISAINHQTMQRTNSSSSECSTANEWNKELSEKGLLTEGEYHHWLTFKGALAEWDQVQCHKLAMKRRWRNICISHKLAMKRRWRNICISNRCS